MTVEGPDGMRCLVYRDGSMVLPGSGPVRLDDLDPASRRIVGALLDLDARADDAQNEPPKDGGQAR
jgi:hypothetical protein